MEAEAGHHLQEPHCQTAPAGPGQQTVSHVVIRLKKKSGSDAAKLYFYYWSGLDHKPIYCLLLRYCVMDTQYIAMLDGQIRNSKNLNDL